MQKLMDPIELDHEEHNIHSKHMSTEHDSKSFWDMTTLGVESIISLTTADEEKWMCTQVSYFWQQIILYEIV